MRKFSKGQDEAEINLTPMLDIVFIMLIFFIVTATFIRETGLDINQPDNNQPPPPEEEEKKNILIQIDGNNRIYVNLRRINEAAVRANIERLYAENPDATVVIQPSVDSATGLVIQIYDEALSVDRDIKIAIADPKN